MPCLKLLPAAEVGQRPTSRGEFSAVAQKHRLVEFKADEFQTLLANESFDGRNGDARLVHVKQKVAAFACREKISKARDAGKRRLEEFLSASPDLVRCRAETTLGDIGAGRNDVAASCIAIERKMHEAAWPQQRQQ